MVPERKTKAAAKKTVKKKTGRAKKTTKSPKKSAKTRKTGNENRRPETTSKPKKTGQPKKETSAVSRKKKDVEPAPATPSAESSNERPFMKMGKGGPIIRKLLQSQGMKDMVRKFVSRRQGGQEPEEMQFEAFLKPMDFFHKMGLFDPVDTSSSVEELTHFRKILEYRADWLELILEETLSELEQIDRMLAGKNKK